MAKPHSNRDSSNSSQNSRRSNRVNILASCYAVNAATLSLKGFHYSTTGAGATDHLQGHSGIPEVSSGNVPSPPRSPPLAASITDEEQQRSHGARNSSGSYFVGGGAAHHITEECERLFCERLKVAFLGERIVATQDSLVMGVEGANIAHTTGNPTSINQYLEMFDYRGDLRFRGFVADGTEGSSMFVFFESDTAGKDLKPGLMALLELACEKGFDCSELVVCLDRRMEEADMAATTRDLGWVGFELTTLGPWTKNRDETSADWLFMSMET